MAENLGFWLWLGLMLFITSFLSFLGYVVWRSEKRGYYRPKPRPKSPSEDVKE